MELFKISVDIYNACDAILNLITRNIATQILSYDTSSEVACVIGSGLFQRVHRIKKQDLDEGIRDSSLNLMV